MFVMVNILNKKQKQQVQELKLTDNFIFPNEIRLFLQSNYSMSVYVSMMLVEGIIIYIIKLTELNSWQLPLPHLKVGYLTAPPVGKPVAPHSDWKRSQFFLTHEGLYQVNFDAFPCCMVKEIRYSAYQQLYISFFAVCLKT